MINWGTVPHGSLLPFVFGSYGGTNGESITISGLSVTDIEVYKGSSMTQRASDNGYALMDTDGIDIDSRTGIHGFTIDTDDNSDSGFYSLGGFFWVIVDAITVDGQTVRLPVGAFRLGAVETIVGTPKADVSHFGGSAGTFSGGRAEVNLSHWRGTQPNTLTSGRVEVLVGAVTSGVIAAASFAANALDAVWVTAERLLTAGTNIVLAKGTGVTGFTDLDAAGVRTAVGLGSANLDTQLSGINTKTTNLPSDPADQSLLIAATDAILAILGTPAGASLAADIATRLATSGYTAPPSSITIASQVRTELTTELGRIDATTSSRATPAQVNTETDTALADVGLTTTVTGRIDAAIATRATPAQVNTEADQALADVGLTTTVTGRLDAAVSSRSSHSSADVWGSATRTLTDGAGVKKNTAFAAFPFKMLLTDGLTPGTGLTVTATRNVDGAGFTACTNSAVEVAHGWSKIDLAAADVNGNAIVFRFTAPGALTTEIVILTEP